MSAETDMMLQKVAAVKNVAVDGELVQKETRYLRYNERQARLNELAMIHKQLHEPVWTQAGMSAEARATLRRRQQVVEKDLREHSPPTDLSAQTRDALVRREQELAAKIREGMPTVEQMRRNPPGAVGQNMRWGARLNEQLEWKNLRVLNNPDSDDPDLANVEILRSSQLLPDGSSTFMLQAQIPGYFAMTPAAKANWPLGEPTARTATAHLYPPVEVEEADPEAFSRCVGTPGHECGRIIRFGRKRCKDCNKTWFKDRIKPFRKEATENMRAVKQAKSKRRHDAIDRKIRRSIAKQEAARKTAASQSTPAAQDESPDRLAAALAYAQGRAELPAEEERP